MKQLLLALLLLPFVSGAELTFHSADSLPLLGTLAPDASEKYTRLPDSLKGTVRDDLWDLGLHSAGLAVRFRTASTAIGARWHNRNRLRMNHMTPTGIRGLDLYMLLPDSTWTFVNSGRPRLNESTTTSTLIDGMEPGTEREYLLYLPLYDGVDSLFIGLDSAATLQMPAVGLPGGGKPIVMYGTSILQGGCATRPGMAHTNILMRDLGREVINLGFSGNARLDPEIARLMAGCEAALYVVDALPNCTADMVDERAAEFIAILRESYPATPILLVESPLFPIVRFNAETRATIEDKNRHLRAVYERLSPGDPNLHYFEGRNCLGDDTECTVDNYHLTDAGFAGFAARLKPVILQMIGSID